MDRSYWALKIFNYSFFKEISYWAPKIFKIEAEDVKHIKGYRTCTYYFSCHQLYFAPNVALIIPESVHDVNRTPVGLAWLWIPSDSRIDNNEYEHKSHHNLVLGPRTPPSRAAWYSKARPSKGIEVWHIREDVGKSMEGRIRWNYLHHRQQPSRGGNVLPIALELGTY